ncbi:hypothetical protein EBBID32_10100 [Sphingobium indicum BiD32]|uniref:Uncharacterized protein n=1 Tax=Sphingobium indicum BiD32 TaxID=1301087 RepID=N1MM55_9SPHN|nr:hypothetical protein EBBID32_10100 [Sphingobium indicum BiD32]
MDGRVFCAKRSGERQCQPDYPDSASDPIHSLSPIYSK